MRVRMRVCMRVVRLVCVCMRVCEHYRARMCLSLTHIQTIHKNIELDFSFLDAPLFTSEYLTTSEQGEYGQTPTSSHHAHFHIQEKRHTHIRARTHAHTHAAAHVHVY